MKLSTAKSKNAAFMRLLFDFQEQGIITIYKTLNGTHVKFN